MSEAHAVVPEQNWEMYSYNVPQGPVFISFCADAANMDRNAYPFCARVIVPIKAPNENGGPTDAEADVLYRMEDKLVEALQHRKTKCVLVARLTHLGDRELVFQVNDYATFRPPVGVWMQRHREYKIDVSEHDGWQCFEDHIWPGDDDWMLIYDRRVVDGLIRSGSNPEKEHSLEFFFVGKAEALASIRTCLVSRDYYADHATPAVDGRIIMVKNLPLDLPLILKESLENRRLAEQLGVKYDGWGASVVP